MSDELPIEYGDPIALSDNTTLSVDTLEGFVRLVSRHRTGPQLGGIYRASSEAEQLAWNLLAATAECEPAVDAPYA